jgi:hypothetical protein
LIVQVPALRNVAVPPAVMVQTDVVDDVNVTACPEVEVAVNVGEVPKFCAAGWANVTVGTALGVTLLDALDSGLFPPAFVAWTVKV